MYRMQMCRRLGICVLILGMITFGVSGCERKTTKEEILAENDEAIDNEKINANAESTAEVTGFDEKDIDGEVSDEGLSDGEALDEMALDEMASDEMASDGMDSDVDEETEITDENEAVSFEICNNNSHFVRCGDDVYFRMPGILKPYDVALWGEYADVVGISQSLVKFSIADSQLTNLLDYSGSGIMGIGEKQLIFRDVENNNDIECEKIASIDLTEDKPTYNEISLGDDFVGVTPDGRYTVSLSYSYSDGNDYMTNINVYEQTKYINTYDIKDFIEIAGIADDKVFFCSSECLMQLDIVTGETINLGKLPVAEYGWGEVQQLEVIDNHVYIGLGFYEGTGHFYSDGYYINAEIDVEDSISYDEININSAEDDYFEDYVPFYVKAGKQIPTDGIPGTVYVGYSDGIVGYYDAQGKKVEVAQGFETVYDDEYTCMIDVELAELVGDKIFLIKNTNIHVPDEDIGWRTAYMRIRAEYYMIDITTKEMECIADIKASDYGSYTLPAQSNH